MGEYDLLAREDHDMPQTTKPRTKPKTAVNASPAIKPGKEAMRARIGSWQDDPDLDDMLKEVFRKRGRPIAKDCA
jgi:hypothetical protein